MSVSFYLDEHVPVAIAVGLRLRGVDVLTVQEDKRAGLADELVLKRSTELRRVLFSQDSDLLREGVRLLATNGEFSGILYAHQLSLTIGQIVSDLELIANATYAEDWSGKIEFLPL